MRTVDPQPTALGALVKKYREARNLSQERLEALMGMRPGSGYVSQIESGQRGKRISRDKTLAFAQALKAPTIEFLQAAGRLEPTDTLSPDPRPSFQDFVNTDPSLRSDQKRLLVELYESWVGKS